MLRRLIASFVPVFLACWSPSEPAPAQKFDMMSVEPTCRVMSDPSSPFQSGLAVLVAIRNLYVGRTDAPTIIDPEIFAPIDENLPALSMCVAETNLIRLLTALAASPDAVQCWNDLTTLATQPLRTYNVGVFGDTVCPAASTLAPCITDVLVPAVESMMKHTKGCCRPLKDQILEGFGAPLSETITSIVQLLVNTFCSERSTETSPPEICGDSLLNNWLPTIDGSDEKAFWGFLDSFQIPNDQVCKAAAGEEFETTLHMAQQFGSLTVTPYGLCYSQMDALTQYVRDLPMWILDRNLAAIDGKNGLFAEGRCLKGADFLSWALDEGGSIMRAMRMIDAVTGVLNELFGGGSDDDPNESGSEDYGSEGSSAQDIDTSSLSPTTDGTNSESPPNRLGESFVDVVDSRGGIEAQEPPLATPATKFLRKDSDHASAKASNANPNSLTKKNHTTRVLQVAGGMADAARKLFSELVYLTDSLCFHIPNSMQCEFAGEWLMQPYPVSTEAISDLTDQSPTGHQI